MTLAEIAEASGHPARTIRFYIARGLLNGPVTGGRSAEYTAEHLARLERIKRFQEAGRTLSEIAGLLSGASERESDVAAPTAWLQHAIADDVMVWVRAGGSPWRTKQLRAAVNEFISRVALAKGEEEEEKGTT